MIDDIHAQRILKLVRITAPAWGISDKALARVELRLLSCAGRSGEGQPSYREPRPGKNLKSPVRSRRDADPGGSHWQGKPAAPTSAQGAFIGNE